MGLVAEIAAYREERGDPGRLVGEFRRALLLLPRTDGSTGSGVQGGLMSALSGGVRWLYAFTDEDSLARFVRARGEGDREWPYLVMLGGRLVDAVVPQSDRPMGVAVNVADGDGAMLFPPVSGIVPAPFAVDLGQDTHSDRGVRV